MRLILFISLSLFFFTTYAHSTVIRNRIHRLSPHSSPSKIPLSEIETSGKLNQKRVNNKQTVSSREHIEQERQTKFLRQRLSDRLDTEWDDLVDNNNDARFGYAEDNKKNKDDSKNKNDKDDTKKMAFREEEKNKDKDSYFIYPTLSYAINQCYTGTIFGGRVRTGFDPCASHCINGGRCTANFDSCTYTCSCADGYSGANCEVGYPIDFDFSTQLVNGNIKDSSIQHLDFPVTKYLPMSIEGAGSVHLTSRTSVAVDISPGTLPSLSIEIWVRPLSNPNNRGWVVSSDDPAGGYDRAILLFDDRFGGVAFGVGFNYRSTLGFPEFNKWTHIVGTWYNGAACTFYRDDKTQVIIPQNGPSLTTLDVGGMTSWANHEADVLLGELKIWNRIVTASEVNSWYTSATNQNRYFPNPCKSAQCGAGNDCHMLDSARYVCSCGLKQTFSGGTCVGSSSIISNYGFELPYVAVNSFANTNPSGWTSSSSGVAITATPSPISPDLVATTEGRQCLSLSGVSSVAQTFTTTPTVGVFRIDVSAVSRSTGGQQEVGFFFDGTQLGSFKPPVGTKTWLPYSSQPKKLSAGSHTIELRGLTVGDNMAFIDNVKITPFSGATGDPCTLNPCSPNAQCKSLSDGTGGISCTCNAGYSGDGQTCTLVNPCTNSNPCSPQAKCSMSTTVPAKPICTCIAPAYAGDGITCNEVDPCTATLNPCDKQNGICSKRGPGVASCTCKPGFAMNPVTNACTASDVCTQQSPCHPNAICSNNPSNPLVPLCTCKTGYSGDGKTICNEIDPCTPVNPCGLYSTCTKTGPGVKTCTCKSGYTGDGTTCTEIDLCASTTNPCHQKATCKKTGPGTAQCTCIAPYQGTGYTCTMTDMCATYTPCDPRATCTNTGTGSYTCTCPTNYQTKNAGKTCDPINPCTNTPFPCHPSADCSMTAPNAYACKCKTGYSGDGVANCAEVDLCVSSNPCNANAQCTKTGPGKATCACLAGYTGTGLICTEVDICKTANPCDRAKAVCTKTGPGTASCQCKDGYSGDGHTCTEINACDSSPCDVHATCSKTAPGQFRCDCNAGYQGSGLADPLNSGCIEKDPCVLLPCSIHATCKKINGIDYTCTCNTGYETIDSGKTCTPINDCLPKSPCDANAICSVTGPGTHSCACKTGYAWNDDGTVCLEINVCIRAPPCHPQALCEKTGPGTFRCTCNPGWVGDGKVCNEQNACFPNNPCDPTHGVCTKTGPGKFKCSCDPGYDSNGVEDSTACTPIDPCKRDNPCSGHSTCKNTAPGDYQCNCDSGWKQLTKDKCVEVNGCESNPCAFHAVCHSQPEGQWSCDCPPGFIGDGTNKCDPDPNAIDTTEIQRLDWREKNFDQDVDAVEGETERVEVNEDKEHDAAQDYRMNDVKGILGQVGEATNQLSNTVSKQDDALEALKGR